MRRAGLLLLAVVLACAGLAAAVRVPAAASRPSGGRSRAAEGSLGDAPDDATLERLFNISQSAARIVAASADAQPPADAQPLLGPLEVWARGPRWRLFSEQHSVMVLKQLSSSEAGGLRALCGRCLYHTLAHDLAVHGNGFEHVFVATGDIDAEWLRDSAVQLSIYLPRIASHPIIRPILEGAIRSQAYWILYDAYANAFNRHWTPASAFSPGDRQRGKGGWVWEHKFELDSGAYFFNLLANYFSTPGLFAPEQLLMQDTTIHDAVVLILRTWAREQRHATASVYSHDEGFDGGRGRPVAFTGLVWGGFRPSDDAQTYGYNIPANAYAAAALRRLLALNAATWRSSELARRASALLADIRAGLAKHAAVRAPDGSTVYAYEVDGLGNALLDFDDPNLPSLLALPLMDWDGFDTQVYANTRRRILSTANKYFFQGRTFASGLGSPHTPWRYIWPLAHMVEALTAPADATGAARQAHLVRDLLRMQCGNRLMHESIDVDAAVDDPSSCTRPVFEWSNAMIVVLAEQLLGFDCDAAAMEEQLRVTARREWDASQGPRGGLPASLIGYARLPEADVPHQP